MPVPVNRPDRLEKAASGHDRGFDDDLRRLAGDPGTPVCRSSSGMADTSRRRAVRYGWPATVSIKYGAARQLHQ